MSGGGSATRMERPLPGVSSRTAPFWEAARRQRLVLQTCGRCGARHFPPVETCDGCLRDDALSWVDASGRGVLFSYVVMHQVYHPAFAADVPYAVLDVKLEEGPRMISAPADCQVSDLCVGMPLQVTFVRRGDLDVPLFRPAARKT